ncbi:MAG: methylmalonyl-CoA mutase family protein [Mariniphaga sp.]|jgi:methylmalonyl-CoA mutase|nr:methylmalonyl-CoA mutase family protein [Mariniphaga sp.]
MDTQDKKNKQARLFDEFPGTDTQAWEDRITEDLKGADYEKKLVWKTNEGFAVKPYYRAEDLEALNGQGDLIPGQFPYLRGTKPTGNDWRICQSIDIADIAEANRQAVEALSKGATAVSLNASNVKSAADADNLLKNIDLAKVWVNLNSVSNYNELLGCLKGEHMAEAYITFDFDPISYALLKGNFHASEKEDMTEAAELLKNAGGKVPHLRGITVNAHFFHNAGATLTQELGYALAAGNEYLASLTSNGLSIDEVAPKIIFTFATGSNYFMEIAKLRAARMLWARIVEQYHPKNDCSSKMRIHSVTANWNKTIYDPYVNVLRSTTEAMSAALGGADMITVLPFDYVYKDADTFSQRIARNQQIILKEESSLDKVADPAAGSYYVENLTASLADAAWKIFLEAEAAGGMIAAIKAGTVQQKVAESAKKRRDDVATRKIVLLGTNQYPNLQENMLEKIQATEEEEVETNDPVPAFKIMDTFRASDEFEDLRLATEIYEMEEGKRPVVFLMTIGNLAMRKARAGFSTNFFGTAGYKIIDNAGFSSVLGGVSAALTANADIVVLCSSDEEYTEIAPEATKALKIAKKEIQIVVAGYPKDIIESLKVAGVDEFIHVRTNVLETLYAFQQKLGVML